MIAGLRESGLTPANYVSGQLLLSSSTTSLNVSNVPTTTIELGNMRNRIDARLMSSAAGQQAYAEGLLAGLERFFAEQ
jgi:N-acetylmuramoyl-L-alanine amidase